MNKELAKRDIFDVFHSDFGIDRLPSIFDTITLDRFFKDFDPLFFGGNGQVVPYDLVEHKDKDGNLTDMELRYALAGYNENDIHIVVDDNRLVCKAEKTQETEKETKSYRHKGISSRRIQFAYTLTGCEKDKITSSFDNGILSINIPVAPKKEVKKIEIKVAQKAKEISDGGNK